LTSSNGSAQASLDSLIADFNNQPTLPQKIHYIANRYRNIGKYERAIQFYQLAAERWPEDKIVITSRVAIGQVHIALGDDEAVTAIIDGLIADFNDHPRLPWAVFVIGEEYYNEASGAEHQGHAEKAKEYLGKTIALWQRIIKEMPQSDSTNTAHAYYFSAVCYRRLGEYENAIQYYQVVVDNWPDYQFAWNAQFMIGTCFEKLAKSGSIPKADAAPLICDAYENLLNNYPDCIAAGAARHLLKRWRSIELSLKGGSR